MSTAIKRRRGTAAEHSSFAGLEGELTVNTTNKSVHVHDGTTAGGHELARADGSNVGTFALGDNDKVTFGAGSDLQIYHDGGNSYVDEAGDGVLFIKSSAGIYLNGKTTDEPLARFIENGPVNLYHDNNLKLATTSTGIDVTGTATMDGLTVDGASALNGNITINDNTSSISFDSTPLGTNGYKIYANINDSVDGGLSIQDVASNKIALFKSNGDISFYEDTGTTAKFFWDASAETLYVGATSGANAGEKLYVDGDVALTTGNHILFGDSDALIRGYQSGQLEYFANTQIFKASGGTERMRIDSSGNVGIGTSSPSHALDVNGIVKAGNGLLVGSSDNYLYQSSTDTATLRIGATPAYFNLTSVAGLPLVDGASGVLALGTAGSERMRIDPSGNLLVGTTSTNVHTSSTVTGVNITNNGYIFAAKDNDAPLYINRRASNGNVAVFLKDGTTVGSISVTGSSTAYNTSSDYRLKEDWQPMADATNRVKALNPVNFAWKSDGSRVDGFLAHEVQEVIPEAVTGTKDAMRTEEYEVSPAVLDDEGNVVTEAVMGEREVPDYQGIDQSKLVPLLTAALQEALTRIETLEAEVSALKGA